MTKTILLLSLLFFHLLSTGLSYAATGTSADNDRPSYTPTVDSLLTLIDVTSGPELLKQYPRLHKALYQVNDPDVHLFYSQRFIEEAQAAKNRKSEARAWVLKIEAMYNYRMPDSMLLPESLKALDFLQDVPGEEVHYFFTASVVGDIYMLQGNYEEALRAAERFYAEAIKKNNTSGIVASLQSMGKAYGELRLPDKAEHAFRESIAAANEGTDSGMKGESYSHLVDMLNDQKRYEEALTVSHEFNAFLQRIDACNGDLENLCFLNYLGYAASYSQLGQYAKAWEYLSRAKEIPVADTTLGIYLVESEKYTLHIEEGRYAEAEQSLDKMDQILDEDASSYEANNRLILARAELYYRWTKYDKAAHAYKDYVTARDSLQRVEIATSLNALRTQYEVDKLEMQKDQQRRTHRTTLLWLSLALLLLCVIIGIVISNTRRLRAKNRSLLDRLREQDKLEEEYEKIRSELARKGICTISGDEGDRDAGELYFRLKELMEDPTVFTDPKINRKVIAEKLNTNEKYVYETIHSCYNMNVSDYITSLRLNHARKLLADPSSGHHNIQTIAFEAGFNSRSTFYRLFKEQYGMTPTEFRELSTKKIR